MYSTYDKIDEMDNLLIAAKAKHKIILSDKVSRDNIHKAQPFFDKTYDALNEAEKCEFMEQLLAKVEVYEERQPNGQWLKAIEFKFPIIEYDLKISLDNDEQVETVCMLSRTVPDAVIKVNQERKR